MTSELLLIFFVTILVFGPGKLPMLAEHFAKFLSCVRHLKQQIDELWQTTLAKQTLLENQTRAEKADLIYRNKLSRQKLDKAK